MLINKTQTFQSDENAEGGTHSMNRLPANSLAEELAASEDLNGNSSEYEENNTEARIEDKRSLKV